MIKQKCYKNAFETLLLHIFESLCQNEWAGTYNVYFIIISEINLVEQNCTEMINKSSMFAYWRQNLIVFTPYKLALMLQ